MIFPRMLGRMDAAALYGCLADATRRRLLALLARRPLCVCHLEAILAAPQARLSRHLAYLRRHGLVTCTQRGAWRIYALARPVPPLLSANLAAWSRSPEAADLRRDRERVATLARHVDCACETPDVPRRRLLKLARSSL